MSQSAHREVSCSFCQQDSTQVRLRLLQGRDAYICVECIVPPISIDIGITLHVRFVGAIIRMSNDSLMDLRRISVKDVLPSVLISVTIFSLVSRMVVFDLSMEDFNAAEGSDRTTQA